MDQALIIINPNHPPNQPQAMLLGLLADCGSRKTLFVGVVGLGALATLYTAYVETYDALFWLRVLSGCVNGRDETACAFSCTTAPLSIDPEIPPTPTPLHTAPRPTR